LFTYYILTNGKSTFSKKNYFDINIKKFVILLIIWFNIFKKIINRNKKTMRISKLKIRIASEINFLVFVLAIVTKTTSIIEKM